MKVETGKNTYGSFHFPLEIMLNDYRYILDKSSRKSRCPRCKKKRFVHYTDSHTGDYLPTQYGRCDREQNCRYHLSPYEDDYHKEQWKKENDWKQPVRTKKTKQIKYVPAELFQKSRGRYDENSFVQYLLTIFDAETISDLIAAYHIGTSSKIDGGCIFYQIDIAGNIRRGKIMVYDKAGHKQYFNSVHSQLGWSDYLPQWRFFGEYLLNDSNKPVALVESEKTAVIASVYFPQYVWLATGTKSTLKPKYAQSLKGRSVTLFPDIGAYKEWQKQANKFSSICHVTVSDLLERKADPKARKKGCDLADYLTGFNPDEFQASYSLSKRDKPLEPKYESQKNGTPSVKLNSEGYPASWDEISVESGTQEAAEAKRHALNDCDTEFERLKILDSKVALIAELFDAEPITPIELNQ